MKGLTLGQLYYLARYSNEHRYEALAEICRRLNHVVQPVQLLR